MSGSANAVRNFKATMEKFKSSIETFKEEKATGFMQLGLLPNEPGGNPDAHWCIYQVIRLGKASSWPPAVPDEEEPESGDKGCTSAVSSWDRRGKLKAGSIGNFMFSPKAAKLPG